MKEQDFQYFMESLMKAAERVDPHYFQLPTAGGDEPIYRERVYCYELYHQLRCILGDCFPYKLYGEVDKSGHPIIRNAKKPDFIVHKPGDMEYNLVVIEVKPVTVKDSLNELREDLDTLKKFLDEPIKYYKAMMLIYGSIKDDLPKNIKQEIENINDQRITVLWHSKPNSKPKIERIPEVHL